MRRLHSPLTMTASHNVWWVGLILMLFASASLAVSADVHPLPYYNSPQFTPLWLTPTSPELTDFHKVPDFSFSNQDGVTVTRDDVRGRIYVANFFFSTCPGICPMIRSKLSRVQDAFAGDEQVLILSHSIRPNTDSVDVLQDYARRHGVDSRRWHLLTGDRQSIYRLARTTYFANEDLGKERASDDFLHTENLLLVDGEGHIRGVYNGLSSTSVGHLIDDIKTLQRLMEGGD